MLNPCTLWARMRASSVSPGSPSIRAPGNTPCSIRAMWLAVSSPAAVGAGRGELMSHTAGATVHGFPGYAAGEPVPTLVQVLDGTPPAKAKEPKNYAFSEERLNTIGVRALFGGDTAGAILLFRLNVMLSPDSMNAYDSLAEAYMRAGDKTEAIAGYQSSLAALARDQVTNASDKESLRKNAIEKLRELGAVR
jgi:tetratricopeptide (TPR) repeat protein